MRTGAILLVGGRSTRMGQPKARLDWHGEPLVARVGRVLLRSVAGGPVVAVSAPGQELPPLPEGVEVSSDPSEGEGPLRGIAVGLAALEGRVEVAFVSSVDAPLLHARFVEAVLQAMTEEVDAAVPIALGHRQPLAAAYRVAVLPLLGGLLEAGEHRPGQLLAQVRTRFLDADTLLSTSGLRAVDPHLEALRNVNTPEELAEVRALPPPEVTVQVHGALRRRSAGASTTARAFHLAGAVRAAGLALDGHVVAAINGEQIVSDPWFPLGSGDVVTLISADAGG
jgi:molybdopterin-guanine dinucleotide biosynthesis protein A